MTADDALREEIARALDSEGAFCGDCGGEPGEFYDSGCEGCRRVLHWYADAIFPIVARVEREAYQRGRVEALREAAEGLRAGVRGSKCNPGCHEADQITLRLRAARIVREAQS